MSRKRRREQEEGEGAAEPRRCARHGQIPGGGSPLRALLEGTVSRRQLHEGGKGEEARPVSARTCGMEARGETAAPNASEAL